MTNRDFCIARRTAELPAFVKVLKAIPQDKQSYRPDPKARSAAELAWLLAAEEALLLTLVKTGTVEWKETSPPTNVAESVTVFERNSAAVQESLSRLSDADWEKKVSFVMAGAPPWEDSLSEFVWGFLFDAIHHRGQLTTYLRPMGSKVPSIYGPSADDPGK